VASLRCESSVEVARPPAVVFPWLVDADKVPRWMTGLQVYAPLAPGPLAVGSRIRQQLEVSGHVLHFELEIVRLEPAVAAELRFEGSGFRAANEYRLTDGSGSTRVTWVISGETTSFSARMLAPMVQRKLDEKLAVDLGRLRTVLEDAGEV
jgi:carbon monoxide dehydrogenase subunit G